MKGAIQEVLRQCSQSVSREAKDILPYAPGTQQTPIIQESFQQIPPIVEEQSCIFVDGGNNVLVHTSSIHIQLQRIAYVVFRGTKKESQQIYEYLLITKTTVRDAKLRVMSNAVPLRSLPASFIVKHEWNFDDDTLQNGNALSQAASMVRKWNERLIVQDLMQLYPETMIVIDGTLTPKDQKEEQILTKIKSTAENCRCVVLGLAKTSSVYADNGSPAQYILNARSPYPTWCYAPACIGRLTNMFVKLHPYSSHVFFAEILHHTHSLNVVSGILAQHAKDSAFPGYPYGLILADQYARVADEHASFMRSILTHHMSQLEELETTQNAHEILDNM